MTAASDHLSFSALSAETTSFESKKMFILVSTVMTWAMTRPQDEVSRQRQLEPVCPPEADAAEAASLTSLSSGGLRTCAHRGGVLQETATPQIQTAQHAGETRAQTGTSCKKN